MYASIRLCVSISAEMQSPFLQERQDSLLTISLLVSISAEMQSPFLHNFGMHPANVHIVSISAEMQSPFLQRLMLMRFPPHHGFNLSRDAKPLFTLLRRAVEGMPNACFNLSRDAKPLFTIQIMQDTIIERCFNLSRDAKPLFTISFPMIPCMA